MADPTVTTLITLFLCGDVMTGRGVDQILPHSVPSGLHEAYVLETAVTLSSDYWKQKGIHYRMHPRNTECLLTAGADCCVLANNHVLDNGSLGLSTAHE